MLATPVVALLLAAATSPAQGAHPQGTPRQRKAQPPAATTPGNLAGLCNRVGGTITSCAVPFGPSASDGALSVWLSESGELVLGVNKDGKQPRCRVDGSATDAKSERMRRLGPVLFAVREGKLEFDFDQQGRCLHVAIRRTR